MVDMQREHVLARVTERLVQRDMPSYERALGRYLGFDAQFVEDGPVREFFLGTMAKVLARLREDPARAERSLALPPAGHEALVSVLEELVVAAPRDEELFRDLGFMPELVTLLAQLLGVFRDDYLAFVRTLPPRGSYRPRYVNMGPSGLCNLRCPSCILWGALFQAPPEHGLGYETIAGHIADAEALGGETSVSLCIGEPTANLKLLDQVLARLRDSSAVTLRSFVTNALFAKTVERGRAVWERILAHLGPEKARACFFAVSANQELADQGVTLEHAVNAVESYRDVMPGEILLVQQIRDEGYLEYREAFLARLVERGLLAPDAATEERPRTGPGFPLVGGGRVVFTVMAKMPPINSPDGEVEADPWVFYLDPEALDRTPFPGLFQRIGEAAPAEGADPGDSECIALGPDGVFYVDYHFMVRGVRPLGTRLPEAIEAFVRDPILTRLVKRGGLNEVLEAWLRIPEAARPVPDLRPAVSRYAAIAMVAANVVFGDEDVALRLARQLVAEDA